MTDWATAAEGRLLDAALPRVTALGWTSTLVREAAAAAGLSDGDAALLLPHGPRDLAALLWRRHDDAAMARLAEVDAAALKIRERIATGVRTRIDAAMADEEAVRRCAGFLAAPTNLPLVGRLGWATADMIWRWAGDTATDENHYSKRAILAGVLTTVLAARLSDGEAAAEAVLARRIDNVMAFEKWKAALPKVRASDAAAFLGRLRYGRA